MVTKELFKLPCVFFVLVQVVQNPDWKMDDIVYYLSGNDDACLIVSDKR